VLTAKLLSLWYSKPHTTQAHLTSPTKQRTWRNGRKWWKINSVIGSGCLQTLPLIVLGRVLAFRWVRPQTMPVFTLWRNANEGTYSPKHQHSTDQVDSTYNLWEPPPSPRLLRELLRSLVLVRTTADTHTQFSTRMVTWSTVSCQAGFQARFRPLCAVAEIDSYCYPEWVCWQYSLELRHADKRDIKVLQRAFRKLNSTTKNTSSPTLSKYFSAFPSPPVDC